MEALRRAVPPAAAVAPVCHGWLVTARTSRVPLPAAASRRAGGNESIHSTLSAIHVPAVRTKAIARSFRSTLSAPEGIPGHPAAVSAAASEAWLGGPLRSRCHQASAPLSAGDRAKAKSTSVSHRVAHVAHATYTACVPYHQKPLFGEL